MECDSPRVYASQKFQRAMAGKSDLTVADAKDAFERGDCARAEAISAQLVGAEPHNAAAWHLLGLARQKLGQLEPALEALAKAASQDRRVARYHLDLGNALLDDGKIDRAISAFRRALRIDDALAEAHNDLGAAYFQKGWHAEAEECFRKALERKPEHGIAHANLGAALRAQGRLGDSRRAFQRALLLRIRGMLPSFLRWKLSKPAASTEAGLSEAAQQELKRIAAAIAAGKASEAVARAAELESRYPHEADVLHFAALAFDEARDFEAGLARIRAALAQKPDRAEYHITLALLLVRAGQHGAALQAALKALKLEPGSAEIHATVAGVYHPWREDLAEQAARQAVLLDPALHTGHGNLAAALWGLGKLEEAEKHGREAVRLKPDQINYRTNLGLIYKDLGRIEEARALYRGLIADAPDHPKLAMDLGTLATECDGDLEAARRWYRKAQAASAEPRAALSEGLIDFLEERFDTAWDKYESRKQVFDQRYHHSLFAHLPQWDGQSHASLLIYGEQGLGDEIMFSSMFHELSEHRVAVMCDPRLGKLFERSFPRFQVIGEPRATQGEKAKTLEGIDAAVAAGSLGGLFRRRAQDFPRHAGYLVADAAKSAQWKRRLGPGLRVGLSWIGGLQKTGRSRRSLSLEQLQPLLATPGVAWVSLQHNAPGSPLREFPGVTEDLDELASLISALDLVISVCNTTVHMAGALGKEVLVMAPFVAEWRYGMSGESMLWYPSARVFRQARYGDWEEVLARIGEALRQRTGAK
jgi:tetratricopeptide (TPR) repeat protein